MKKRSLLIIDDDQHFLMALGDHFGMSGMEIYKATTGKEGLQICKKKLMDVVILDQKLPDVDGDSICKDILSYNDKSKIILIITAITTHNVKFAPTISFCKIIVIGRRASVKNKEKAASTPVIITRNRNSVGRG